MITVLLGLSVLLAIYSRSARSIRIESARHLIAISNQPGKTSRLDTLDPTPDERSNGLIPHGSHHHSGSGALPCVEGHAQYARKAVNNLKAILTDWAGNWGDPPYIAPLPRSWQVGRAVQEMATEGRLRDE